MNYRSFADLGLTIKNNLNKIPRDIDVVVGIPRSGMTPATIIGQFLNKPVVSIDSFLEKRIYETGLYRKPKAIINHFSQIKKALIVDDSINSGQSMAKYRNLLSNSELSAIKVYFLAVYYIADSLNKIDIGLEECSWPRIFQWNILNSWVLSNACVDIDGVLNVDPLEDENDDGENYKFFLLNTTPLFLPDKHISCFVTNRLEKYRSATETWLKKYELSYSDLIMLDLPSKEDRIRLNAYGLHKGEIYKNRDETLFIESNTKQAIEISNISNKLVFSVENMEMIYPSKKNTYFIQSSIFKSNFLKVENKKNIAKSDICFFIHTSSLGGAERSFLDLIKLLVSNGVICSVVMPGEGALKNACQDIGVIVKTIKSMAWWCNTSNISDNCFKNIGTTLRDDLSEMIQFVQSISPDAIYSQTIVNPFGAIVAEELNLPHFWALREYGEIDHGLNFCFNYKDSMDAMFKTSDYIFSITSSVSEIVLKENYTSEKVKVNYSKVDIPKQYENKEYKRITQQIKIGVFGSIVDGKNQADAISALIVLLKQGYDIELYLVGYWDKEYYSSLMGIIENTNFIEKIKFIGYVDEPIEVMNDMDIVISCAKLEALGRVLIEAILLKIPIIYSNVGGPQEIYTNELHGLSYRLNDEKDLADKIIYTIHNQEKTQKRVDAAYQYILNTFNEKSYATPIIEALKKVKKNSPSRTTNFVTQHVMSRLPLKNLIQTNDAFIQLFIDQGDGFSEENSIKLSVEQNAKSQEFIFDLTDRVNIKALRIDPLNDNCVVAIESLHVKNKRGRDRPFTFDPDECSDTS